MCVTGTGYRAILGWNGEAWKLPRQCQARWWSGGLAAARAERLPCPAIWGNAAPGAASCTTVKDPGRGSGSSQLQTRGLFFFFFFLRITFARYVCAIQGNVNDSQGECF